MSQAVGNTGLVKRSIIFGRGKMLMIPLGRKALECSGEEDWTFVFLTTRASYNPRDVYLRCISCTNDSDDFSPMPRMTILTSARETVARPAHAGMACPFHVVLSLLGLAREHDRPTCHASPNPTTILKLTKLPYRSQT